MQGLSPRARGSSTSEGGCVARGVGATATIRLLQLGSARYAADTLFGTVIAQASMTR